MSYGDNKILLIISIYLLIMNVLLFFTMGADKFKAKTGRRRVPEARLFLLALLGGSLGGIGGMIVFRHKTKHNSFRFGFPAIFIAQLALTVLLINT